MIALAGCDLAEGLIWPQGLVFDPCAVDKPAILSTMQPHPLPAP